MKRIKKVRGHKRRWRQIEEWTKTESLLNFKQLSKSNYCYSKVWIHPWSGIALTNSQIPELRGKTRQLVIQGLIHIYNSWKEQLEQNQEPYYLKIWLFHPHISKSQVVCAFGDRRQYYDKTFYNPEENIQLNLDNFGLLRNSLSQFEWSHRLDEQHLLDFEDEVGSPEDYSSQQEYDEMKQWFLQEIKKPHRTYKIQEPMEKAKKVYSFKIGDVWIGELKAIII